MNQKKYFIQKLTLQQYEKDEEPQIIDSAPVYKQQKTASDNSPGKKAKKQIDLSTLHPIGLKVIVELVAYIMQNPDSNIFENYVYSQDIKGKKKQTTVYLINSDDFFETIELFGIMSMPIKQAHKQELQEAKESIKDILCLDTKYRDLLMLKKINQVVNQINLNEDLKLQAKYITFTHSNEPAIAEQHKDSDSEPEDNYDEEYVDDEVEQSNNHNALSNLDKSPKYQEEMDEDYDQTYDKGNMVTSNLSDPIQKSQGIEESYGASSHNFRKNNEEAEELIYSDDFNANKSDKDKSQDSSRENIKDFSDLEKEQSPVPNKAGKKQMPKSPSSNVSDSIKDEYEY